MGFKGTPLLKVLNFLEFSEETCLQAKNEDIRRFRFVTLLTGNASCHNVTVSFKGERDDELWIYDAFSK